MEAQLSPWKLSSDYYGINYTKKQVKLNLVTITKTY